MSVEAGTVRVNGTSLYYEIMGEGHPLVLIHGGLVLNMDNPEEFNRFVLDFLK